MSEGDQEPNENQPKAEVPSQPAHVPEPVKEQPRKTEKPKERKPGIFSRMFSKLKQYQRVLYVAQKPDKQEFTSSLKVTLMGMVITGALGFTIYMIYNLVF